MAYGSTRLTNMAKVRKSTQGKLGTYTKAINDKKKLLAKAKKEKYPKYMLDELVMSIKKSQEAKNRFIKFSKMQNKLK